MIHRYHPVGKSSPPSPDWPRRLAVALVCSGVVARLAWWGGANAPMACFLLTCFFFLSVFRLSDISEKYAPESRAGNMLDSQCNAWRLTRHGILLYRDNRQGPCLCLPWQALQTADLQDVYIRLWNEKTDTFYMLPAEKGDIAGLLHRIRAQITKHASDKNAPVPSGPGVYFMSTPWNIPLFPFIVTALPWFIFGLLSPVIFPGAVLVCLLFFAIGASIATMGHHDLEEDFCRENYVGHELRRTRRGIIVRSEDGFTCFIPWAAMEEGIVTSAQSVFLRMRGEQAGLVLSQSDGFMPIPIVQRYATCNRRMRNIARIILVLAAAVAGLIWCSLWN